MRYFLLLTTLLCIGSTLQAQELPIDPETGKIVYQEVVEVPAASADELFQKANYWLNTYFPSIQNQVEMIDSVNHEVVCKRYFQVADKLYGTITITTTAKIEAKAEKYRFTFSDFNALIHDTDCGFLYDEEAFNCRNRRRKKILQVLPEKMSEIISTLKSEMKTEKDDW